MFSSSIGVSIPLPSLQYPIRLQVIYFTDPFHLQHKKMKTALACRVICILVLEPQIQKRAIAANLSRHMCITKKSIPLYRFDATDFCY